MRCWVFVIVFKCFFNGISGFYFSRMARYRFMMDCNTFWMVSGTSKLLSKYGPVDLLSIAKMLQKIMKMRDDSWNILFFTSENLEV